MLKAIVLSLVLFDFLSRKPIVIETGVEGFDIEWLMSDLGALVLDETMNMEKMVIYGNWGRLREIMDKR